MISGHCDGRSRKEAGEILDEVIAPLSYIQRKACHQRGAREGGQIRKPFTNE